MKLLHESRVLLIGLSLLNVTGGLTGPTAGPRRNRLNGQSRLTLTAKSGEVLKRLYAWKEEVGAAL